MRKRKNKNYINFNKYYNIHFFKNIFFNIKKRNKIKYILSNNNNDKKRIIKKNIIKKIIYNKIYKNKCESIIKLNKDDVDRSKYNIKLCVFLGREKNIRILHSYIELGLKNDIINEYHMFNFSRIIHDHNFVLEEYNRLNNVYKNRIFIHNSDENLLLMETKRTKIDWSPFYKYISQTSLSNDIIIKCDDDILFIDIFALKNAIEDRIKDSISFVIHSNCINNGVCTFYQRNLFTKLTKELEHYPVGGILGIIFEKPEIAYALHSQFTHDIISNLYNINKYIIEDIYINSRISINFILLRGDDMKYVKDITSDDEYQISGYIPEKLGRPNKIKGDLITSHFSYTFQDKILSNRKDIIIYYEKIRDSYIQNSQNIIDKYNNFKINLLKLHVKDINGEYIYQIKNWFNNDHYYIKNKETNKYLNINYEEDEFYLSDVKNTYFTIKFNKKNIIEIILGIYYLTRYNSVGKFRNEAILLRYLRDEKEKELLLENNDENDNFYYIKFLKYNVYFSLNNKKDKIDITTIRKDQWILEKINKDDEIIECKRLIKDEKIYYEDIKTKEMYSNYYKGWGLEGVLW